MSIKGRPYTWFRAGLEVGSLSQVRAAAGELDSITLVDALRTLELIAEQEPATYDRAATRWLGRYVMEHHGAGLKQTAIALDALQRLPGHPAMVEVLDGLTR